MYSYSPNSYLGIRMNLSKKKRKIAKFPQNRLKMNEIAKFGRQKKRNSCLKRKILMPEYKDVNIV